MTREIIMESAIRIVVNVFRLGRSDRILDYYLNLGKVSKQTYKEEENDLFNYIATDNRDQLVRENEEFIRKMKERRVGLN